MTKFQQAPHKCLKLEDIVVGTPYAISINPQVQFVGYDKQTKSNSYTCPNSTMKKYLENHLQHCKYSTYELYFELSPIGRQHFHGFIHITDIEYFFTKDIHILKTIGTFDISRLFCREIEDGVVPECGNEGGDPAKGNLSPEDSWLTYCTKQQKILKNKYNINTNIKISKVTRL